MIYLHRLLEVLITPPAISLIFILLGLFLLGRWKWTARGLITLGLLSLYLLSTPFFMDPISASWDYRYPMPDLEQQDAQAIVVLGGGRRAAIEFGGETLNRYAMERVRYGARLHKETGLPILVTGGIVSQGIESEAALMERFLEELGIQAQWLEEESRTTYENAVYSAPILEAAGIDRILLVTHGVHMPRSVWSFQQAGVAVIPAPTVFEHSESKNPYTDFLPQAGTLYGTTQLLHEWLGLAWYKLSKS